MSKVRKPELSFVMRLVVSSYSTNTTKNTLKGIRVTERTRNQIQIRKGGNYKSKKAKVVILLRDTSSHPVLHFYQVS